MDAFSGVIVPMITPFNEDFSLDMEGIRWLVSFLSEKGVHGLFVNSTTGEFVHLKHDEIVNLVKTTLDLASGPKVLPGITSNYTGEVISLGREMKDLGADGVIVAPPYFFKLKEDRLHYHFSRIANEVDLPIIIYNIPSLTGNDIPVSVYVKLAQEFSNVVGAKISKDSVSYIRALISRVKAVRKDFSVLTGMDDHLLNVLALGGDGGIMALANVAPQLHLSVYNSWNSGKLDDAVKSFRRLANLARIYDLASSFPTAIKTALSILGSPIKEVYRPPLTMEPAEVRAKIRDVLEEVNISLE